MNLIEEEPSILFVLLNQVPLPPDAGFWKPGEAFYC